MDNKVGRQRWGYHYNLFPACKGWTQVQLSIRRHPHEDLKCIKLCLGQIRTRSETFLGFLCKTKMKAHTKLTVLMCCQIFARKSVSPSSSDFGGDRRRNTPVDKIGNLKTKCFSKIVISLLLRTWPDFCECITSMNFQ